MIRNGAASSFTWPCDAGAKSQKSRRPASCRSSCIECGVGVGTTAKCSTSVRTRESPEVTWVEYDCKRALVGKRIFNESKMLAFTSGCRYARTLLDSATSSERRCFTLCRETRNDGTMPNRPSVEGRVLIFTELRFAPVIGQTISHYRIVN